jgi:N-acetyl sugar amidotransferase
VLPDTRPNLVLDAEGVCNACRVHEARADVDWGARAAHFRRIAEWARDRSSGYDCVVPVSGGKDSIWQVVTCLDHDLKPLAVTWHTPGRTPIGAANLASLVELGVDHVDYQVSPAVERRFMRAAFERLGDSGIPMHMALFAIPLATAVRFRIPLVVWGENSAVEYGTTGGEGLGFAMDEAWLRRFGVTHGTTWRDWVGPDLPERDLVAYRAPEIAELEAAGSIAIFLGHFFPWDPARTAEVARGHGFRSEEAGARTGYYDFADIDDHFISVHHHLKWHKFGFTRSYDNLSLEIRNGRMTRERAVAALRERGDETPNEDIARFLAFTGMTREEFDAVCERFRNPEVWTRRNGRWEIDGFLIPDWEWT